MIYSHTTGELRVEVTPTYLEEESSPSDNFFAWSYLVAIYNLGHETVQLLNRHWEITDGQGLRQVIDGPGVIGKQPVIGPGDHHRYSSWTWLKTPSGFMTGYYEMINEQKSSFNITIPALSLDSPAMLAHAN